MNPLPAHILRQPYPLTHAWCRQVASLIQVLAGLLNMAVPSRLCVSPRGRREGGREERRTETEEEKEREKETSTETEAETETGNTDEDRDDRSAQRRKPASEACFPNRYTHFPTVTRTPQPLHTLPHHCTQAMEALAELDPARAASIRALCAALAAARDEEQQDIWGKAAVNAEGAVRRVGEEVGRRVGARVLLVFDQARGLIEDVPFGDAATCLFGGCSWWRESSLARSRRARAHAAKPLPPARPLPTRAHIKRLRLLRAREVMQRLTTTLRRKKREAMQRLTTTLREGSDATSH